MLNFYLLRYLFIRGDEVMKLLQLLDGVNYKVVKGTLEDIAAKVKEKNFR